MSTVTGYTARRAKTGEEIQLAMQRLWLTGEVLPAGARLMVQHVFRSAERKPPLAPRLPNPLPMTISTRPTAARALPCCA